MSLFSAKRASKKSNQKDSENNRPVLTRPGIQPSRSKITQGKKKLIHPDKNTPKPDFIDNKDTESESSKKAIESNNSDTNSSSKHRQIEDILDDNNQLDTIKKKEKQTENTVENNSESNSSLETKFAAFKNKISTIGSTESKHSSKRIDTAKEIKKRRESEPDLKEVLQKEEELKKEDSSDSFLNDLIKTTQISGGKAKKQLKEVDTPERELEEKAEVEKQKQVTEQIAAAVGEAVKAVQQTQPVQQPPTVAAPKVVVYDSAEAEKEKQKEEKSDSLLSAIFEGEKKEKQDEIKPEQLDLSTNSKESKNSPSNFLGFSRGNKEDNEKKVKPIESVPTEKPTPKPVPKVPDGAVVSIGEILKNIVKTGLEKKASDIHIEPRESGVLIRYRIDGILIDDKKIDKELEKALIFKTKVSAKLRTDEHFAPQDGRIVFDVDDLPLNTRISILPTASGEKIVIRLLTQRGKSFDLADLGFREFELETIRKNYTKPYGTIIAAGPTGSGKTTTLYAILSKINSRDINITTVEDPVEYELEGVNHVQINSKAGLSFEKGLRSILRQDPDVIMIGEIRDKETAEIAINAAMTGHLVLSTIHTNDSITSVPRLIDMGVEPFLVASAVNLVVAQRLSRRLCDSCKKQISVTAEALEDLNKIRPDLVELLKVGESIYQENGCDECNGTGFSGRVGLYELFEVTQDIRKIIIEGADSDKMFELGRANGMNLIIEDGIKKLREGLVSISELLRVTALKQ